MRSYCRGGPAGGPKNESIDCMLADASPCYCSQHHLMERFFGPARWKSKVGMQGGWPCTSRRTKSGNDNQSAPEPASRAYSGYSDHLLDYGSFEGNCLIQLLRLEKRIDLASDDSPERFLVKY
jgi:hypothetical protein